MNRNTFKKIMAVVAAFAIIGIGVNAFAGKGYGRMGWGGQGQGYGACQGQGYGPNQGRGFAANLSEEDVKKIEELRSAFFEATSDLRQEVRQRKLTLASELAKKNPDATAAKALQKEISELKSQLAEKRIDHMIEMKKINPNMGGRWMSGSMGYGRGPGFGHRGGGWQ